MTTRKKTGTVAFRPRARLLKLIGAELISDEVVAVSELVKNAHDADALGVTIAFRGVTGADGEIDIRDDGLGMSLETAEPRIHIEVQAFDNECELLFADNGPGIPAGVGDRIFEPLFSRKEASRGMGLTIAPQMLEAHGRAIDVLVDGRRKGANFVVTLARKRSRATIYRNGAGDGNGSGR